MSIKKTAKQIDGRKRNSFLSKQLPGQYLKFENTFYSLMSQMVDGYTGGYFEFMEVYQEDQKTLGWFLDLNEDGVVKFKNDMNGSSAEISYQLASAICTLIALSAVMTEDTPVAVLDGYYDLRDFILDHGGVTAADLID